MDRYDPSIALFSASSSEEDDRNIYKAGTWPYPYLQKDPNVTHSGWCPDFNSIKAYHIYYVYLEVS